MTSPLAAGPLLLVCLTAAVADVRTRRIPNWLSVSGVVAGLASQGTMNGWCGLRSALLGLGLAMAVYFPLFALRALGAGDVKLMGAIGAILGPGGWLWIFVATCLIGGVIALIVVALRKRLSATLWNALVLFQSLAHFRSPALDHPELSIKGGGATTLPHALPIAIAACLYVVTLP